MVLRITANDVGVKPIKVRILVLPQQMVLYPNAEEFGLDPNNVSVRSRPGLLTINIYI